MSKKPFNYRTSAFLEERYDSEFVAKLKGSYKTLSSSFEVTQVNFNDDTSLFRTVHGCEFELDVSIVQQGRIDALILWWTANLTEKVVYVCISNISFVVFKIT